MKQKRKLISDKVTQSNAVAAEENAAAAGEMSSQSNTLQELVSQLESVVSGMGATQSQPQQSVAPAKSRGATAPKLAAAKSVASKRPAPIAPKAAASLANDFDMPMPEPMGSESHAGSFKEF